MKFHPNIVATLGLFVAAALWASSPAGAQQKISEMSAGQVEAACNGGSKAACLDAAWRWNNGKEGAPLDKLKARSFSKKACDLGDAKACSVFASAIYYDTSGNGGINHPDFPEYVARGCERGDDRVCLFAAYTAAGTSQWSAKITDPKRRLDIFERACRLNDAVMCEFAGYEYLKLNPGQYEQPLAFYRKACSLGREGGCVRAQDIVDWNTNRAFYDKVLAEARSDGSYAEAINYLFAEGRRDQETLGKLLLAGGLEGLRGIENQPLWSMAGWSWNGQYSALKQQLTAESRRREAEGNAQAAENLRRFRAEAAAGRANTGPVTPKIKIERCYQMPSSMGFPGGRYCSKD